MIIAEPPVMTVVERRISQTSLPSLPEGTLSTARTGSDTVSISKEALQASRTALASTNTDQAPDEASIAAMVINGTSQLINDIRGTFLKPENIQSFRNVHGDEATKKYVEDLNSKAFYLDQALSGWNQRVAEEYETVGPLPTKQEDGTWSQGSFSLSRKGSGFEVRAGSDAKPPISRNNGSSMNGNAGDGTLVKLSSSDASIALQMLNLSNIVDYKT